MKWYPFWKQWYFTRDQRLGLWMVGIIILLLIIIKGPIINYLYRNNTDKYKDINHEKWTDLQTRLDSMHVLEYDNKSTRKTSTYKSFESKKFKQQNIQKQTSQKIEINKATAEQFQMLKGIGPTFSKRIIKYREKLGGFYEVAQIKEVYGVDDTLYRLILPNLSVKPKLNKLNINTSSIQSLENHPYISRTLAKQIVGYREKVKPFDAVEELKKMYAMTDSIYNKLYPYLTIY